MVWPSARLLECGLEALQQQLALSESWSAVRVEFGEPVKQKRPKLFRVMGRLVEQPSPEVCSQPPYLLTRSVGMAPACHALHGWATRAVCLNIEFGFPHFNPILSTLRVSSQSGPGTPHQFPKMMTKERDRITKVTPLLTNKIASYDEIEIGDTWRGCGRCLRGRGL